MAQQKKPDYGIDAPGVIRNLVVIGALLPVMGHFVPAVTMGPVRFILEPMLRSTGIGCFASGLLMLLYVKLGKFGHRDWMLGLILWNGSEMVLDVGTGRGLLMIGAAKKLATGKAYGIDIWSAKDLSGNRVENTLRNAQLEGVSDRIEVRNEDATAMKFQDATFDVVLSNLCLHNIPSAEGRAQACREISRVLKPGGTALISDFQKTRAYAKTFREGGMTVERRWRLAWNVFPPLAIVRAQKPEAGDRAV